MLPKDQQQGTTILRSEGAEGKMALLRAHGHFNTQAAVAQLETLPQKLEGEKLVSVFRTNLQSPTQTPTDRNKEDAVRKGVWEMQFSSFLHRHQREDTDKATEEPRANRDYSPLGTITELMEIKECIVDEVLLKNKMSNIWQSFVIRESQRNSDVPTFIF